MATAVLKKLWTLVLLFASSIAAKISDLLVHLRIYHSKLHSKVKVIETTRKSKDQLTLGTVLEST